MVDRSVTVRVDANVSPFVRAMGTGSAAAGQFAHNLESADGRMAALVQTGLALAPALVPLGTIAIPAVAGLTTQLTAAAAAGAVTILAFQGIGDAVKAMQDQAIDPTDAHLKKMHQTLDALGPAGQVFAHFIQGLRPDMQELQDVAQMGLFPGLQDGIEETLRLAPQVKDLIGDISGELGDMARDGGAALDSPRWRAFIKYLDSDGVPTLRAMGKSLGFVTEGFVSLLMDFDPLADDFTHGMVGMSKSFRDWADGLDQTEGFEHFVDYVRQNGPEALDTLGALGGALLSLIEAAAPVGSALLPVITELADGLSAIAESPVGPTLITAAAGIGALGRALALLKAVGLRGDGSSMIGKALGVQELKAAPSAYRAVAVAEAELRLAQDELTASMIRAHAAQGSMMSTVQKQAATDEYAAAQQRVATATQKVTDAEKTRTAALRSSVGTIGKAAGVVGGLVAATNGWGDSLGLANTTTDALLGSFAGPWGIAIGGAIGLIQDFTSGSAHAGHSLSDWNRELAQNEADLTRYSDILGQARSQLAAMQKQIAVPDSMLGSELSAFKPDNLKMDFQALFGDLDNSALGQQLDQVNQLESNYEDLVTAVNELGHGLGGLGLNQTTRDTEKLNRILAAAKPAMDALGYSVGDLAQGMRDGSITQMIANIRQWNINADSARARTRSVADSFKALDDAMNSTEQSAQDVAQALDDLLSPNLNLSAATDEWTTALRHLNDDLAKHNKTLKGNSDAAIKNRAAIRDRVQSLEQVLTAEADAGASSGQLSRKLQTQREALIQAGKAAGISEGDMRAYLHTLGLTPKLIRTIINADTSSAERALAEARRQLAAMDGAHATAILELDTVRTGPGGQAAGYVNNAMGSMYPSVRSFAWGGGDVPNGHMPEFAGPGVARVWRERETGGESYIPHANDRRRPRAKSILEQTASMFGGAVTWFGDGGMSRHRLSVPSYSGGRERVIERIVERVPTGRIRAHIEGVGDAFIRLAEDAADDRIQAHAIREEEQAGR
jgi:hypothetical protein